MLGSEIFGAWMRIGCGARFPRLCGRKCGWFMLKTIGLAEIMEISSSALGG